MAPRYTTLADLKARLQDAPDSRDDELTAAIDAAEAAVDTLTAQVWKSPAASEEFFSVDRCTYLLRIPPAQSVTAVAEKNDGSWTTLDDEDWSAVETPTGKATRELVRESGWWKPTRRGEASVRVSGVFASTATAPPEIAMASLKIGRASWRERV